MIKPFYEYSKLCYYALAYGKKLTFRDSNWSIFQQAAVHLCRSL